MAETFTPRLGLRIWGDDTDGPSRGEFNEQSTKLEEQVVIRLEGTRAARPQPGVDGRLYTVQGDADALLNGLVFYDDGTQWINVGAKVENAVSRASGAASVPQTVRGATGQTANLQEWRDAANLLLAFIDRFGAAELAALKVNGLSALGAVTASTLTTTGEVVPQRLRSVQQNAAGKYRTDLTSDGAARLDGLIPPGAIMMWLAAVAPAGWTILDGRVVSRTGEYADLFALWGTAHNTGGELATEFRLPNMTERVPIGAGTRAVGTAGGSDTVTLLEAQLPSHAHPIDHSHSMAHTHAIDHDHPAAYTNTDGAHVHTASWRENAGSLGNQDHITAAGGTGGSIVVKGIHDAAQAPHRHLLDLPNYAGSSGPSSAATTGVFSGGSGVTGGGQPVSVVQQYRTVHYIAKV